MSIVRTNNLQNPDSSGNNIELTQNGGAIVSGVATAIGGFSGNVTVGTGATINGTTDTIVASTNGSERVRIISSGNVGIGTSIPDSILHLYRQNPGPSLLLQHSNSSTYSTVVFRNDANKHSYMWQNGSAQTLYGGVNSLNVANYNGPIAFSASTSGGWAERLRLTSDGTLGIGITNPKGGVHSVNNNYKAFIISNNTTNSTATGGVIAGDRYTKTNNPFVGFATWDYNTGRKSYVGGGGWNLPEATEIGLYTATTYDETNNAALERLKIDSAGRVTMPYQPMFSAQRYDSDGSAIISNVIPFLWTTVTTNIGNSFDNSTGKFTAPVAGNYFLSFNFNRRADYTKWTGLYIMKNTSILASSWFPPNSSDGNYTYAPVTVNYLASLAANDTIAFCYHNSYSAPSTGTDGNFVSIFLVG